MTTYRGRTVAFYLLLAVGLLLIVTHTLPELIPKGLATRVGHNSESLLFALGFCPIVQFLLPKLRPRGRSPWPVTVPAAAACFAFGYYLLHSGWPSSLVTLNEPVLAMGFMLLYASLRRPLRHSLAIAAVILVFIVAFFNTAFVLAQAESLVPAMLAPLALDVFDRTILEPQLRPRHALRLLWMALLVTVAVTFMIAARWARKDLHGPVARGIDYGQRAAEAYWGWLLVHAYFGYWIGQIRAGSATPGARRRDAGTISGTSSVVR